MSGKIVLGPEFWQAMQLENALKRMHDIVLNHPLKDGKAVLEFRRGEDNQESVRLLNVILGCTGLSITLDAIMAFQPGESITVPVNSSPLIDQWPVPLEFDDSLIFAVAAEENETLVLEFYGDEESVTVIAYGVTVS